MVFHNAMGGANYSQIDILVTSTVMGSFSALTALITRKIEIPRFAGRRNISQFARQINH